MSEKDNAARLFAAGLDNEADTVGYHGTSIEAVKILIETGSLPPSSCTNIPQGEYPGNRIYFFPVAEKWKRSGFAEQANRCLHPLEGAELYAHSIAQEASFMAQLGLDYTNRSLNNECSKLLFVMNDNRKSIQRNLPGILQGDDYDLREIYKRITSMGRSEDDIRNAYTIASARKGVVLGIGKTIRRPSKKLTLAEGDKNMDDLSIICPQGLSIKHITGIEPMGNDERDELEGMLNT